LVTCIIFSLFPDIDHPRSFLGKIFFPISKYLDRNFGHRTLTHGLLFFSITVLVALTIEKHFLKITKYTLIISFSYLSHLLFDMMTIQGIPSFYPFKRNPCVIPGNPELRFKSGNFHSETIIFCILIVLVFTCKDLFKQGFWTSYNKAFGSIKHVAKEFKRSSKLIKIEYNLLVNGKTHIGEGYVVGVERNRLHIYTKTDIITIPFTAIIYSLKYQKTEKDIKAIDKYFFDVDIDFLNQTLQNKAIITLRLNSKSEIIIKNKNQTSQMIWPY